MNCPEPENISALADGELDPLESAKVHEHIKACPTCERLLEEMRWTALTGSIALLTLPAGKESGRKPIPMQTSGRKPKRALLMGIAAALAAGLVTWGWLGGTDDGRHHPEERILSGGVSSDSDGAARDNSREEAFARWAAHYREMEIPRVPMAVAATYEPEPIALIRSH